MKKGPKPDRSYKILPDIQKGNGANYIEIGTGRFPGNVYNEGSIYISKESFLVVSGIIKKHYTKYDHYEMKNISRTTGTKIAANLREAAERVLTCKDREILSILEYHHEKTSKTINDLIKCRADISGMLVSVADYLENAYEKDDWICVMEI